MTNGVFVWKVTRLEGSLLCFMCAWFMATLCEAPNDLRLYVSLVSGLSCMGSSVFHYGANTEVYSRKRERMDAEKPWVLKLLGGFAIVLSMGISLATNSFACVAITATNGVAVWFYAGILSKEWYSKNITIALICTTPAVMGWLVGTHTHPATWLVITLIFITFFAKEHIKDVIDVKANNGLRVTIPIRFGVRGTLLLAGGETLAGSILAFLLCQYFWSGVITGAILFGIGIHLIAVPEPRRTNTMITFSMALLILSFV